VVLHPYHQVLQERGCQERQTNLLCYVKKNSEEPPLDPNVVEIHSILMIHSLLSSVMPMFKIYNCSILFYKRKSQFMYMLNAFRLNMITFVFQLGLFYKPNNIYIN
jgi:hypothetical protein